LIYSIFTSSLNGSEDTGLTLTNVGPQTVFVHLFLIDGRSCTVADFFSCLSPAQTTFWLASELDPGVTGYVVALATNQNGLPLSFNYLFGTSKVKFTSGYSADLPALAFSALYPDRTVLPGVNQLDTTAELKLDGQMYSLSPVTLSINNLVSPVDNNSTLLILNPVGGDLSEGAPVNLLNGISGLVYDERERPYSFISPTQTCQIREVLRDGYPRIPNGLSRVIPSGVSGTVRFSDIRGTPIMGAMINYNPNVLTSFKAFNQGHILHHLNYTNKAVYKVPIIRPTF
ncbi:MAG TPA: hypothetical protein VFZ34_27565, partial [Blastocatellia bacterium]|nr:hypothetical protein [Blastocatellia bacterium]